LEQASLGLQKSVSKQVLTVSRFIPVHQRHIRPADVYTLAKMMTVEFNIEGNPFQPPFMEMVRQVKPTQCTPVPDDPYLLTGSWLGSGRRTAADDY